MRPQLLLSGRFVYILNCLGLANRVNGDPPSLIFYKNLVTPFNVILFHVEGWGKLNQARLGK